MYVELKRTQAMPEGNLIGIAESAWRIMKSGRDRLKSTIPPLPLSIMLIPPMPEKILFREASRFGVIILKVDLSDSR